MTTRTRQEISYRLHGDSYTNTYLYTWAGAAESYGPQELISVNYRFDGSFITSEKLKTMTDTIVENYYARSKAGEVFINPMTSEHAEQEVLPGSGFLYFKKWPGFASYFMYGPPIEPYLDEPQAYKDKLATAISQASTQAMARVSSESMLLLATLGELGQTKDMLFGLCNRLMNLRKPLSKLLDLFKRKEVFRRYNINRIMLDAYIDAFDASKASLREIRYFEKVFAKRVARDLREKQRLERIRVKLRRARIQKLKDFYLESENIWMEIRMGWRPFFGEIQNFVEAMQSKKENPPRKTFRGKALPIEFSTKDTRPRGDPSSWYVTEDRTIDITSTVKSGVLCRMRTNGFPDTWGLTKIPQTIWELTTLSWAVDYFFNIGEVIAACTPDTLWEPIGSWSTVEETIVQIVNNVKISHPDHIVGYKSGIKVRTVRRKRRIPGTSIAITFRPRLTWEKYIDIVAVTRQKISPLVKQLLKHSRRR